ncbi:RHS repeat protein [Pedobacter sp. PF22-3]|uniref:RHS repeat domain-containing protein n=1 Tax=Pedobacter sp. PF22-3 TaxID=2994467 RepID=UPI0022470DA1|nr:RHS repeat domain-containing protein [Pedobacter sp. PF22-3]MCX2496399.1 RHS repeat protein [Pedobacter sp. PF22-3]
MRKLSLILFLFPFLCAAQETYVKIKQVVPSSPQTAAFGKFGDIPVGNFTGAASVSVPVYTINIKDFSLPISIAYHTAGIRVEEISSNVGLGWALNAGGSISASVNGLPDFGPNGFCVGSGAPQATMPTTSYGNFPYNSSESGGGIPYKFAKNVADGIVDSQPDIFSYSFPGGSGKFYFDQNRQVHTIPFNNLKIERSVNTPEFMITDEKGIRYLFQTVEVTSLPNNCGADLLSSTVLLSKIILTDNNEVTFNYQDKVYNTNIQPSRTREVLVPGNFGAHFNECNNYMNTVNTVYEKRLASITTTTGVTVSFDYDLSQRTDLPGANRLQGISISNGISVIDNFTFFHSYFGSGPSADYFRLRLDRVVHSTDQNYGFEYDNIIPVPHRLSFAQDHWGFYNGKSNPSLLPIETEYGFNDGADRNVDENYAQMAILKKVTYPTGGSTSFQYESNRYPATWQEQQNFNREYNVYSSPDATSTRTFTIPAAPSQVTNIGATYNAGPELDQPCTISLSGPNGYFRTFDSPATSTSLGTLAPGTYTMSIATVGTFNNGFLTIRFDEKQVANMTGDRLTGGLRVLRTTDSDGQHTYIKRYLYSDPLTGASSGRINALPKYTYIYTRGFSNAATQNYSFADYYKQTASSLYPLGSINGGSVGYTCVQVFNDDNGVLGKTVSRYSFEADAGGSGSMPTVPTVSHDWQNGLLLNEEIYKQTGSGYQIQKETTNYYSVRDDSEYWNYHFTSGSYNPDVFYRGLGINIIYKQPEYFKTYTDGETSMVLVPAQFLTNDYHLLSRWQRLDSIRVKDYIDGSLFVKSGRKYTYGPNHLLLKTDGQVNSDGLNNTVEYYYPQDVSGLSGNAEVAHQQLLYNHNLSAVLRVERYSNAVLKQTEKINYRNWGNNIVAPETVETQASGEGVEGRVEFIKYDTRGNLLCQGFTSGPKTCYVYSYNGQYLVAEIKNADYQAMETLLGGPGAVAAFSSSNPTDTQVNTLVAQLRSSFPEAAVTGYTYKPLVGMTSQTDAKGMTITYEYDAFQRLKTIKDQNGNILKQTDYHYKN